MVEVMLQGACQGCPSSTITLKMGIEARLKEEVPEVLSVVVARQQIERAAICVLVVDENDAAESAGLR